MSLSLKIQSSNVLNSELTIPCNLNKNKKWSRLGRQIFRPLQASLTSRQVSDDCRSPMHSYRWEGLLQTILSRHTIGSLLSVLSALQRSQNKSLRLKFIMVSRQLQVGPLITTMILNNVIATTDCTWNEANISPPPSDNAFRMYKY